MRFRPVLITFILSLSFAIGDAEISNPPADLQLNATGRRILIYFQGLQANPDFKILSGQFCNYGPDARLEAPEKIFQTTGRWPAMIAVDYTDFKNKWVDTHTPNRLLIDYWRDGGLCSVSVHLNNPAHAEGGGLKEKGLNIAEILVPHTPVHDRWMHQLDDIATGLQELQAAGVAVLWRPFHEMNGSWFWWGAQKPADFIKVWQHMFTYFTQTKSLHNLIWVYGPNHGPHVADYYPGDEFVDLVGLDAYTDNIDPDHIKGYKELSSLKKPFGFTEYGPHGASDPTGDFDFRRFPAGLARHFPRTRFFLSWDAKWNPAENKFAREFYNDARVITRADLPANLTEPDHTASLKNWRAERVSRLTKVDGWLTLVGRHQLQNGENSLGTAQDNSIKLATGPAYLGSIHLSPGKVLFTPAPGAILQIDGQSAQPSELNYNEENPTNITFGTASFHIIERGGMFFIRVKDRASDRLKKFAGIDYFPADLSWQVEAQWIPFDPPHQVNITNMLGQTAPALVPGKAVFKREGHTFELLPIDEGDEELFFVFTDLTAGGETYEASRFLYTEKPKDGKIILDFNRAQNPPCAFTPFATCPLPPKGNSLPIRVPAGEKRYRGRHD